MGKMFWNGVPTAPDVNRLMKAYPVEMMRAGWAVGYNDVADVINVGPNESRFKSVTLAWRKNLERDYNIILQAGTPTGCFSVLAEPEKVGLSRSKLRSAINNARRSMRVSAAVNLDELDESARKDHDFNINKGGALLAIGQIKPRAKLPKMEPKGVKR